MAIDDLTTADGRAEDNPIPGPYGLAVVNNRAVNGVAEFAGGGGVADLFGARLKVVESTFIGNSVSDGSVLAGGAIFSDVGSTVDVVSSCFQGNTADLFDDIYGSP